MSTVAHRCYQMVTIATGEDMMSPKIVATVVVQSHHRGATIEMDHKMSVAKVGPPHCYRSTL
jgi:hypothetical protein